MLSNIQSLFVPLPLVIRTALSQPCCCWVVHVVAVISSCSLYQLSSLVQDHGRQLFLHRPALLFKSCRRLYIFACYSWNLHTVTSARRQLFWFFISSIAPSRIELVECWVAANLSPCLCRITLSVHNFFFFFFTSFSEISLYLMI